MKAPANTSKILKAEAERLTNRIFRNLYCIVHYKKTGRQRTWKVEKHHLILKGQSVRFQFNIMNILPVSDKDHRTSKEAAHEDRDKFLAWVKDNLPLHWAWYLKHRYDKARTIRLDDWSKICDELRYYENNPYEAEQLIYEK